MELCFTNFRTKSSDRNTTTPYSPQGRSGAELFKKKLCDSGKSTTINAHWADSSYGTSQLWTFEGASYYSKLGFLLSNLYISIYRLNERTNGD